MIHSPPAAGCGEFASVMPNETKPIDPRETLANACEALEGNCSFTTLRAAVLATADLVLNGSPSAPASTEPVPPVKDGPPAE